MCLQTPIVFHVFRNTPHRRRRSLSTVVRHMLNKYLQTPITFHASVPLTPVRGSRVNILFTPVDKRSSESTPPYYFQWNSTTKTAQERDWRELGNPNPYRFPCNRVPYVVQGSTSYSLQSIKDPLREPIPLSFSMEFDKKQLRKGCGGSLAIQTPIVFHATHDTSYQ